MSTKPKNLTANDILFAVVKAVEKAQADVNTIKDMTIKTSALYGLVAFSRELDKELNAMKGVTGTIPFPEKYDE